MPTLQEVMKGSGNLVRRTYSESLSDRHTYLGCKAKRYSLFAWAPFVPILIFEVVVVMMGSRFFNRNLGFDLVPSLSISLCVEYFYMYFSAKKTIGASILRYSFFLVSISCLTYGFYVDDKSLNNELKAIEERVNKENETIALEKLTIKAALANISKEEMGLEKDMDEYRKHGLITKGKKILSSEKKRIEEQRIYLLEKLKDNNNILQKEKSLHNQKIGFWRSINLLSIKTKIAIFTISIIQIGICFALPELLENIKSGHNS